MAYTTSVAIHFVRFTTINDDQVITPLTLPQFVWQGGDVKNMAEALSNALQTDLVEKGQLLDVYRLQNPWPVRHEIVDINITKSSLSKSKTHTSSLPQKLDVFHREMLDGSIITYIPVLNIEVFTIKSEALHDNLTTHIQSEYTRQERFSDARKIIECQWYQQCEVITCDIDLKFHTPKEMLELGRNTPGSMMKTVANKLKATQLPIIGLEKELQELEMALDSRYARSTLIIGAEGSGKTALFNEYVRQRKYAKDRFWETTASQLLQGLTGDTGWQQSLILLLHELRETRQVLHVGHLLELFEVGQYEGNSISIGDALKEPLQRGELILVGEITVDELATLNLRAPGISDLFMQLHLQKKSDEALEKIVVESIHNLARRYKSTLENEAVLEILRLQHRYTPYSGLPGKTIRFFESIILQNKQDNKIIDRQEALRAFCEETGMPAFIIDPDIEFSSERCLEFFQSRIFGQDPALLIIDQLLLSVKTAMLRTGKPIASLMFVGPTGVGKTEMAKTLAEYLFGDRQRICRFDMSEYSDAASVLRLTGEWGGSDGSLVSRIRQQPFSVVLLDEIEKAHFSFFDLLLQILGEGRLTDARGRVANFCSAVVIMTSNIGADEFQRNVIGFQSDKNKMDSVNDDFVQSVQSYFRPELINRLDRIIPFMPIAKHQQNLIITRELRCISSLQGIANRKVKFDFNQKAVECLAELNQHQKYGARQIQRIIRQQIITPLAKTLNSTPVESPCDVMAKTENGTIKIRTQIDNKPGTNEQSLLAIAQNFSNYRRIISTIHEGVMYNAFSSEYDILKNKSKRKSFIRSDKLIRQLNRFEKIISESEKIASDITSMEGNAIAHVLGVAEKDQTHLFDSWLLRYRRNLRLIYKHTKPEADFCIMGIYGNSAQIKRISEFYTKLIEITGFAQISHAVILEDEAYTLIDFPVDGKYRDYKILGLLLEIEGDSCGFYFQAEAGVQTWQSRKHSKQIFVDVRAGDIEKYVVPENVHRSQFYESLKSRRTVTHEKIHDQLYKTSIDFNEHSFSQFLDKHFDQCIENALTGDDE